MWNYDNYTTKNNTKGNKRALFVDVENTGSLGAQAPQNKKRVFKKYLDTGKYARVRVFDDSIANLKALLSLEDNYPDIKIDAWLVQASGNIRSVK